MRISSHPQNIKTVRLLGPYRVTKPSAWFYVNKAEIDVHAQVLINGETFHVNVSVPRLSKKGARSK